MRANTTLLQDFRLPVVPKAEQYRILFATESYFSATADRAAEDRIEYEYRDAEYEYEPDAGFKGLAAR